MSFWDQLPAQDKRISIVGMAKNSGKTTTLNYLIEEAWDAELILGVTSTGRDGESVDLVTGTDKPRVFLETDTIVSVPVQLYDLAEAGLEILRMTRYQTPLGPVLLCRVVSSGYVQIAGPVKTTDHRLMCQEMLDLGVDRVLIDGAVDRRSIAAPSTSDAIVLATGAVLSRSLKKVVSETLHVTELFRLPRLAENSGRSGIANYGADDRLLFLDEAGQGTPVDLLTGLNAGSHIDEAITQDTRYVYLPGALTKGVVADIHPAKLKRVTFVTKDPTRIFIGAADWQQLRKRGLTVAVLETAPIVAVTVNPFAPAGYSFGHQEMLAAMRQALGSLPVIDVRYNEQRQPATADPGKLK